MKLNIFRIPVENIDSLKAKLNEIGMTVVYSATVNGWETEFYFSNEPEPVAIPWVEEFSQELASLGTRPTNSLHYGAFIWHTSGYCFALSFGKSHFYLREFCNSEFGLDMARRIGERDDVRQKAARRYAGRRKKEIRSYQRDTQLDVESGESIDYLQSATIDSARWGSSAKFGTSMLVNPPIDRDALPRFLGYVQEELAKNPLYQLPRIEVVTDAADITRYDQELLQAILTETAEFEEEGHQLVGVEFVFSGAQEYSFRYGRARSATFGFLSMSELRAFIRENSIGNDQLFNVKVRVTREDSKEYSQNLRQTLEYSIGKYSEVG